MGANRGRAVGASIGGCWSRASACWTGSRKQRKPNCLGCAAIVLCLLTVRCADVTMVPDENRNACGCPGMVKPALITRLAEFRKNFADIGVGDRIH